MPRGAPLWASRDFPKLPLRDRLKISSNGVSGALLLAQEGKDGPSSPGFVGSRGPSLLLTESFQTLSRQLGE
jgi:hypothetical protein